MSGLASAICAVMQSVGYVQKTGNNTHHRYRYASDADLLRALQPAMAEHGLAMWPCHVERHDSDTMCHLVVTYELRHTSGETACIMVPGSGSATKGSEDKGAYKAMTGAYKYALRQLFAVPTGDDPEDSGPTADDVKQARRHEGPAGKAERAAAHDPEWEADRARFCAALPEAVGADYDAVKAWALAEGMGSPSSWGRAGRSRFMTDAKAGPDLRGKIAAHNGGAA